MVIFGIIGCIFLVLVLCVLAITFLGTPATSRFSSVATAIEPGNDPVAATWIRWTATDGSFSVEFPRTPKPQEIPGSQPNLATGELVVDDHGSYAYAASYGQLQPGLVFDDPQVALDGAVDGAAANSGMELTSRTAGSMGLLPAQYFTGTLTEGLSSAELEGVAFLSQDRIFVLFAVAEDPADVDFERFKRSFALA